MNILIAKTILQSWINEEQVALFPNDAQANFEELCIVAGEQGNEEILKCLETIYKLGMVHILENKEGRIRSKK